MCLMSQDSSDATVETFVLRLAPGFAFPHSTVFFLLFILLLSQTLVLSAKFPQGQIHIILGSIVLKSFLFGKVYLESLFFLISKCNYK